MLRTFLDIHTHTPDRPHSILSVPADKVQDVLSRNLTLPADQQQFFSIELHPWHLNDSSISLFLQAVDRYHTDSHFVAIGECGLDGLCSTPMDTQLAAFRVALQAAHHLLKPVIIHCVRCWSEIIAETRPYLIPSSDGSASFATPFVIHGFRKGPVLARQLVDAGFSLSFGKHFNPASLQSIPADRLYHETDEE